jgi:hypothetical protein
VVAAAETAAAPVTGIVGRVYLDPGDALSGPIDPPELVEVLVQWAVPERGGPRNVKVRRPDGSVTVIPFTRRLRLVTGSTV